jgi:hypothetical protein
MDTTGVVAILGVVGTPVVAIAGYIFNERRGRDDRAAARELSEGTRTHELQLRRNERAYDARRDTYVDLVRHCIVNVQVVQATEPIITFKGDQGPPELPPGDEWRDLQARVSAFGSHEVGEAADAFYDAVRKFFSAAGAYRFMRERAPGPEMEKLTADMMGARENVNAAFERVTVSVREDLASL